MHYWYWLVRYVVRWTCGYKLRKQDGHSLDSSDKIMNDWFDSYCYHVMYVSCMERPVDYFQYKFKVHCILHFFLLDRTLLFLSFYKKTCTRVRVWYVYVQRVWLMCTTLISDDQSSFPSLIWNLFISLAPTSRKKKTFHIF